MQTPHVIFDEEEKIYKMWFVVSRQIYDSSNKLNYTQKLYYAKSSDGLKWRVTSGNIFDSARSPFVIKGKDGSYTMWMNSGPLNESYPNEIYKYIFRYKSQDCINWTKDEIPAITPEGKERHAFTHVYLNMKVKI